MWSILAKIFGSDAVIEKSLDLIDDAWTTEPERLEAKAQAKIALMNAYAPFKIAQRYLALMFATVFLFCFVLVLGMTLAGSTTDAVFTVIEQFKIDWAMSIILMFYFGGGLVDSIQRPKTEGKK